MLDVSDLAPGERTLRPFDIACKSADGSEFDVKLDLLASWARHHERVAVAFHQTDYWPFGWNASLVGENGEVLLGFPYHEHADRNLAERRPIETGSRVRLGDDFPVELTDKGWDELDQGWWGRIIPDGDLVYVAETDFDGITDNPPGSIVCDRPGRVLVGDVEILWNRTSREAYDRAWEQAIVACRSGRPSPVGDLDRAAGCVVFHT